MVRQRTAGDDAHTPAPLGRRRCHQLQLAEQRQEQYRRQPLVLRELLPSAPVSMRFIPPTWRPGTVSMGTVSLMDWAPKAAGECSFSVKKYGAQKATNPDNTDCGNGILLNGTQVDQRSQRRLHSRHAGIRAAVGEPTLATYGPANAGGVRIWRWTTSRNGGTASTATFTRKPPPTTT